MNNLSENTLRTIFNGLNPLALALERLSPGAEYVIRGITYEDIEWSATNTQTMPAPEEIDQTVAALIDEYTRKNTYIPHRQRAYPSIAEQLDMLYWDMENGTTHWRDTIREIKQTYPKA